MPYPSHLAATLSGASLRQLQYWRQSDLLKPEFGLSAGKLMYSFQDVVALRTFVFLRESQSLQHIRAAVSNLRELGNIDHLASYRLVSSGSDIILVEGDEWVSLASHPGQLHLAVMKDVFAPFNNLQGVRVVDLRKPRPKLSVDPEIQGGYPVIQGSRVEYDLVAGLIEDGVNPRDIKTIYPSVGTAAARDAYSFAQLVTEYRLGAVAGV